MYFIEKCAVYSHGVFWIGDDLDSAIAECNRLASIDVDDHHSYIVFEFGIMNMHELPNGEPHLPFYKYSHDPEHKEIYKAKKIKT